jgi:hypothetical protein
MDTKKFVQIMSRHLVFRKGSTRPWPSGTRRRIVTLQTKVTLLGSCPVRKTGALLGEIHAAAGSGG